MGIRVMLTEKNKSGEWVCSFKDLSKKELIDYKRKAYSESCVDWSGVYSRYNHMVYYSELYDHKGDIYYAEVYLDGTGFACDEQMFDEIYKRPGRFVFALHR